MNNDEKEKPVEYDWVFGQSVTGMIEVGQIIKKRLKVRQQILDLKHENKMDYCRELCFQ